MVLTSLLHKDCFTLLPPRVQRRNQKSLILTGYYVVLSLFAAIFSSLTGILVAEPELNNSINSAATKGSLNTSGRRLITRKFARRSLGMQAPPVRARLSSWKQREVRVGFNYGCFERAKLEIAKLVTHKPSLVAATVIAVTMARRTSCEWTEPVTYASWCVWACNMWIYPQQLQLIFSTLWSLSTD
jgi:hypothetical protein